MGTTVNPPSAGDGPWWRARFRDHPVWALTIQIFLGLGWARTIVEKAIDPRWWDGSTIRQLLADNETTIVGWYQPYVELFILPAAPFIAFVVLVLQLVASTSLLTGYRLSRGLLAGIFLNVHFIAAGEVNPSMFYLLGQGAVALWLAECAFASQTKRDPIIWTIATALIGFWIAILTIPFVQTMNPADVVDDAALMLVAAGMFVFASLAFLLHRATGPWRPDTAERDQAQIFTDLTADLAGGSGGDLDI